MSKIEKNSDLDFKYCECKTVIIGAGVSGVSAALNLLKNSYQDFLILEADNRIGGRCFTLEIENGHLDFGAELVHGQIDQPIFELALKNDLICDEDRNIIDVAEDYEESYDDTKEVLNSMDIFVKENNDESDFFLTQFGDRIPINLANNIFKIANNTIRLLAGYGVENKNQKDQLVGSLLYDKYIKLVNKSIGSSIDKNMQKLIDGIFLWRCKWENIEKGCSNIMELSSNYFGTYKKLKGSQIVKLKKGYKSVLDLIISANKGQFYEKLKLKHCVKKILICLKLKEHAEEYDPSDLQIEKGVCSHCVYTQDENKIVLVVTDMTEMGNPTDFFVICEKVLCTFSLGYLKDNIETLIDPLGFLPKEKLIAVKRLGFGNFVKIFLIYDTPFWEEDFKGIHLIWLPEDRNFLVQKLSYKTSDEKAWYENICSFKIVHSKENVLCAYVSDGRDVEALDLEVIKNDCTDILRRFLKRQDIPYPREILRSQWDLNPFFRGVYSYPAFGAEPSDFSSIGKPISFKNRPFVLFAGEATHAENFSTVHGAYFTGLRESERILNF